MTPCPAAIVAAVARRDPDRVALIDRTGRVGYRRLDQGAARIAAWLARQGLAPGDMVGLTLRHDTAHLLVTLALLRLGCHQVTLASFDPPAARAAIARRAQVVAVLGDEAADACAGLPLLVPDIPAIIAEPPPAARPPAGAPRSDGVVVFTSSGTTGRVKLIPSSAAMIVHQAPLNPPGGRVWHVPAGVEFTRGKRHHLHGLAEGATLVLASAATGATLQDACAALAVERLLLAPHQASSLADQVRPGGWPRHTRLHLSGAPVPGALRRRLREALTPEIYVVFGATEFGVASWAGPSDHEVHPDGLGRAPPGVELAVVDPDGIAVPDGAPGVLRVRSPGCITRYLDDPVADARALRDGWFHTGDVVRRLADGTLLFGGREDDMMILGTINVFPLEIELAAADFPGVAECAAFALRSATLGDIPALAVVPASGATPDAAALLTYCRTRLGLRAPRRVILLPALPRNAAGKVRRQDLAGMAAAGAAPLRP